MNVSEIRIANFKSYRNCRIHLGKVNVVTGVNGSGKSNLIEIFKLLKYIYEIKEVNPFLHWWGYNNVVYKGEEEAPISVELLFKLNKYNVHFTTTFTGTGGVFRFIKESIDVEGIFSIIREGNQVTIRHDKDFVNKIFEHSNKEDLKQFFKTDIKKDILYEQTIPFISNNIIDCFLIHIFNRRREGMSSQEYSIDIIFDDARGDKIYILSPLVRTEIKDTKKLDSKYSEALFFELFISLQKFFYNISILVLNINEAKKPYSIVKDLKLSEDGSNLHCFLHNLFLRENKWPERIKFVVSKIFADINIIIRPTEDGRTFIIIKENGFLLPPKNIPDGFYKILAILSALEVEPSILVIDEIENSLHPKAIEVIFDTIKSSDATSIITTHSSAIIDINDLSDLIILEKKEGETIARKIDDTDKAKKKLKKLGLTFSEGWLHDKL